MPCPPKPLKPRKPRKSPETASCGPSAIEFLLINKRNDLISQWINSSVDWALHIFALWVLGLGVCGTYIILIYRCLAHTDLFGQKQLAGRKWLWKFIQHTLKILLDDA